MILRNSPKALAINCRTYRRNLAQAMTDPRVREIIADLVLLEKVCEASLLQEVVAEYDFSEKPVRANGPTWPH